MLTTCTCDLYSSQTWSSGEVVISIAVRVMAIALFLRRQL